MKERKWRWVGHTLRRDELLITREAMFCKAEGKRKRGRPKGTWRRSTEDELKTSFGTEVMEEDRER